MKDDSFTRSGTLSSASVKILPLELGRSYHLIVGLEGDDFGAQSVIPKLFSGVNSGSQAQGTLDLPVQPTAGDKMRIGGKDFEFTANLAPTTRASDSYGLILIGPDLSATQANIVHSINGTGTTGNRAHPLVTAAAFAANSAVITAVDGGSDGNAVATTATFTDASNQFDAATLGATTAGTDDVSGEVVALPEIGALDSDSLPATFSAPGMVTFEAGLPYLALVPSGAVTSARYNLTLLKR